MRKEATKGKYCERVIISNKLPGTDIYCMLCMYCSVYVFIHILRLSTCLESTRILNVPVIYVKSRLVCPNFGHPALTSPFTKYKFEKF